MKAMLLVPLLFSLVPQESKPIVIDAGALTCEVHISRTAHLFHVVDQISEWSEYCHRQYGRHFDRSTFSETDRAMLARHTLVRNERGWGAGLEQTFYTALDLDDAIQAGLKNKHLDEEQSKTMREVLLHFAPLVDKLLKDHRERLSTFAGRLKEHAPRLKDFADRASRLFGGARHTIPVHLLANPAEHDMGGGYNGERLTLEIPLKSDAIPTLFHEVFHAFLHPRMKELEKASKGVEGLDAQTLNEGLAYAISPGLFHTRGPKADPLREQVKGYRARGVGLEDNYARFHMFGLALRPFVREALDKEGETFDRLLARAVDAWRVLREVEGKSEPHDYRDDPKPCAFVFGPGWKPVSDRLMALQDRHVFSRNHAPAHYDEIFARHTKPGDLVVLLVDLSAKERIPAGYHDLLPKPWKEIEASLQKGETVELGGKAREFRVVLLAAPAAPELERMARESRLIPKADR